MNKFRYPKILLLASAIAVATTACGDDDDDSGNVGGTSSGGSKNPGTAGASAAGEGTTPIGEGGALPGGGGATAGGAGGVSVAGGGGDDVGGQGGEGGEGGEGGAATAALSDAQVLLVLDTLNQGEVEVAYAALPKLEDADVKDFAQMMITDHGSARQAVHSVADSLDLDPRPSDLQLMLKQDAETLVATFQSSPQATLDRPYIASQIAAHADALNLLTELSAATDATELKELIMTLETSVQAHYDEAQAIEASLP
jgi:putative membrane protein